MTVKGVFFDLYGTLIVDYAQSSWSNWESCFSNFLLENDLAKDEADTAALIEKFWRQEAPSQTGMTPFESRIHHFCQSMNHAMQHQQVALLASSLCDLWQSRMTLDAEAIPLLRHLKSSKTMALISNFDHPPHVYSVLEKIHISHYFEAVIISGEVGVKKPDPTILELALAETDLAPESVVYIGDSIVDYEGATAAGIKPILVRRRGYREVNSEEYLDPKYREAGTFLTQLSQNGKLDIVDNLLRIKEILH
jgi:HAD superfamily hydrolase (TIGR01549 family)